MVKKFNFIKNIFFILKIFFLFLIFLIDVDLLKFIPIFLPLLFSVAFLTIMERKVLAAMQRRRGPNYIGLFGLLQAIADAIKLLSKETVISSAANIVIFVLAPLFFLCFSFLGWGLIFIENLVVISDSNFGLLFLIAITSLGVYSIIMSG
jgi:NADH-quinone oxidoreductase subunit H